MSLLSSTLTLAGMSPSRCSRRSGVTVTVSSSVAGDNTTSISTAPEIACSWGAKPPARTISVPVLGASSMVKRPSGPVTVCRSSPDAPRTTTEAPETAPPLESLTMPVMASAVSANERISANTILCSPCPVSFRRQKLQNPGRDCRRPGPSLCLDHHLQSTPADGIGRRPEGATA